MDITEAAHPTAAAAERGAEPAAAPRRWLLAAGLGGALATLVPALSRRALARPRTVPDTEPDSSETGSTTTVSAPASPTTTLPPEKRPTAADIELLSFAQTVEIAIRNLYDVAIDGNVFDGEAAAVVTTIRESHEAYAQALSGLLARDAPNTPNVALVAELESSFTGSATAVAQAAASLENRAVATHLELVNALVGVDGSALIASILEVEARHAVVLTIFSSSPDLDSQLAGEGEPFSPTAYPVE